MSLVHAIKLAQSYNYRLCHSSYSCQWLTPISSGALLDQRAASCGYDASMSSHSVQPQLQLRRSPVVTQRFPLDLTTEADRICDTKCWLLHALGHMRRMYNESWPLRHGQRETACIE